MISQLIDVSRVHPARVSAGLPANLPTAAVSRLIACRRLAGRLAAIMVVPNIAQQVTLPASSEQFPDPMAVAHHAGAAWHAATLRAILNGQDRAAIATRIGEPAYRFGLSQQHHGHAPRLLGDSGSVALAVEADGLALLGRWLRHESVHRQLGILMRLPPGTPAEVDGASFVRHADDEAIITATLDHLAAVATPKADSLDG